MIESMSLMIFDKLRKGKINGPIQGPVATTVPSKKHKIETRVVPDQNARSVIRSTPRTDLPKPGRYFAYGSSIIRSSIRT
jgi:hypothetical protein